MFRLLDIEFQKLRYNRAAKVMSIIYFALFFGLILFASIRFNLGDIKFQFADQGIFDFPYIWHFNTFFAAYLKILLAIVIVSIISTEYTNRTLKQNLIDGLSKKEFVLSKFYMIIAFTVASTLLVFGISLVLGLIYSDHSDFSLIFSQMQYLGGYFLKLLGFFSFCFFLGVLVKRSAFALGTLFLWWIVEGLIWVILKMTAFGESVRNGIRQILPLNAMADLIPEPVTKLKGLHASTAQLNINRDYSIHWFQVFIVLLWTAIFIYASYRLIEKRDL